LSTATAPASFSALELQGLCRHSSCAAFQPEPEPTPPVFHPAAMEYTDIGTLVQDGPSGVEDEDGVLRRDDGIIQAQSMCTECEENGLTTSVRTGNAAVACAFCGRVL